MWSVLQAQTGIDFVLPLHKGALFASCMKAGLLNCEESSSHRLVMSCRLLLHVMYQLQHVTVWFATRCVLP